MQRGIRGDRLGSIVDEAPRARRVGKASRSRAERTGESGNPRARSGALDCGARWSSSSSCGWTRPGRMPTSVELAADAQLRIGASLAGKWRLEAVLGIGGTATVYEATHLNGRRVAIKMLHRHLSGDPRLVARFLREAHVVNSVEHPALVAIFDDGVDEAGRPFLVLELLRGRSLEQARIDAGGALPLETVHPLGLVLLQVLEVAHASGVIHRDIKPANLFVDERSGLRVLDFGLARAFEASGEGSSNETDAPIGTAGFMAPEQASGRWDLVDGRTDLWSVGATLLRLLTGQFVHDAKTSQELIARVATQPVRPTRERVVTLEPAVADVLDRALSFARPERFASALEMATAWKEVAPASLPQAPGAVRVRKRASMGRALGIAIGVGVIVAAAALALTRRTEPAPRATAVSSRGNTFDGRDVGSATLVDAATGPPSPATTPTSRPDAQAPAAAPPLRKTPIPPPQADPLDRRL